PRGLLVDLAVGVQADERLALGGHRLALDVARGGQHGLLFLLVEVLEAQLVAPARVLERVAREVALGRHALQPLERRVRRLAARVLLELLGLLRVAGREAAHDRGQRHALTDERDEDRREGEEEDQRAPGRLERQRQRGGQRDRAAQAAP